MKQNNRLLTAIIIVAGLLIWPVGWNLYTYLPELRQFSQTEYTNYLIMVILGFYIAAIAAIYLTSQKPSQEQQPQTKHSHHGNPPKQNTTGIEQLTVDVAFLKERMTQVETIVTGLQVFFKSKEEKKE